MEPRIVPIEEFYDMERELTKPAPKRKGIDHAQASKALAGYTDRHADNLPIPDWVYGIKPEKKKKRRRRA